MTDQTESPDYAALIEWIESLSRGLSGASQKPDSIATEILIEAFDSSIAALRALLEERDELKEELNSERINNEDLANSTYYKGNSVSWWESKATNYKNALGIIWGALNAAGVHCDGKKHAADGVRELQSKLEQYDKALEDISRAVRPNAYTDERLISSYLEKRIQDIVQRIRKL